MFDRIAWVYDALNGVMTAGLHHRWRARAVDLARVRPGSRVLDLATGTGDLALELARRVAPGGEVVGSDFSEEMLTRARAKCERDRHSSRTRAPASVRFEWGDALQLPYENDSFDAATVGFGARNFSDLARGLREMARVVRPGGRVVVLEMTSPDAPAAVAASSRCGSIAWCRCWDGWLGTPTPTPTCPTRSNASRRLRYLAAEMERAGIGEIGYLLTAGGIIAIHAGTVPTEWSMMNTVSSSTAQAQAQAAEDEEAVAEIMRRGGEVLRERMVRTEEHLERVAAEAGAPLAAHATATVLAGGKRLRPLLVVLAAAAAGDPSADEQERVVRAAVAVELVHSATLVHDDVIDGAQLRRGHPSVVAQAGRRVAMATGDLLFSRAFAELARNGEVAQLRALSDASSALAEGELLQREDAYAPRVAVERYLRRCELKTAALFEAACRLGALVAGGGGTSASDRDARGCARGIRATHRPGLSAARRRARCLRARWSAPASHVGPICSTAPSRCR